MKKNLSIILALCFAVMAGCATNDGAANGAALSAAQPNAAVDIDLTVLSSTMVYAEVYNMMEAPENYLGKTVKIEGVYYSNYYDATDTYYHFVIIEDAAACCQSGLEFIWNGADLQDYPEENVNVMLTGVFEQYEELGQMYYYLATEDVTAF